MSDDAYWERQARRVFALLREAHISEREERLNLYRWFFQDECITSTNDLSAENLRAFAETLTYWQRERRLEEEARKHVGPMI